MVPDTMSEAIIKRPGRPPGTKAPWKFTRSVRERFLGELQAHGKPALAAQACGVGRTTVDDYVKKYPGGKDFQRKMELAIELYQAKSVDSLESQALNGIMEPILDKAGHQIMVHIHDGTNADGTPRFIQVPGWRRKYETALRVAVFNRYNPAPKDGSEVQQAAKQVGVLAVPVPVSSVDDWGKLVANLRKPVLVTTGKSPPEEK
jgi:hypothetical protein